MRRTTLGLAWLGFLSLSLSLPSCASPAPSVREVRALPTAAGSTQAVAAPSSPVPRAAEAAPRRLPQAKLSLTASDGSGLRLAKLVARAVVLEPLALTELHLSFENPRDRVIEGSFKIALPQGATVSRFAMKIGDDWQEGEVVEKQAAREAYEDFLHKRQDPALLEQAAGNEFTARVFPIPAKGTKEMILSYTQELAEGEAYALPLRGLPEIGELEVVATLGDASAPAQSMVERASVPTADFVLEARSSTRGAGLRSGDLVVTRVSPVVDTRPDPFGSTIVLVDTSASRALGFAEQLALLKRLASEIAARECSATLTVACFDQGVVPIFEGAARAFGDRDVLRIAERRALGASDLEQALGWARDTARSSGATRVILVTDGVATAGALERDNLGAAARALHAAGVERIDAITVGGIRDDAALRRLVIGGEAPARDGVVVDGASDFTAITRRLALATRSGIPVRVEGARWSWPQKLDGVQAGDSFLVYADVPASLPVALAIGSAAPTLAALRPAPRPLLERAWVQAKIASLASGPDEPKSRQEIVALSVAHRVLSPYTALLVLETEDDYARFKIDRRALADILTVERGQVARTKRASGSRIALAPARITAERGEASDDDHAPRRVAPPPPPPPPPQVSTASADMSESFGGGGLGLAGVGGGGGGSGRATLRGSSSASGASVGGIGHGRAAGSRSIRAGAALTAEPERVALVSGGLPSEAVAEAARRTLPRVRACYQWGLRTNPQLRGRVAVRVTIGPGGDVTRAMSEGSTMTEASVVACVVRALRDASFPASQAGTTPVIPFSFVPTAGEPLARTEPYTGNFKTVMDALGAGEVRVALDVASDWHRGAPGDVLALVALGEAFERRGDAVSAARAYGSIVDLFSARADLRRFAGGRLERIAGNAGLDAALDTYTKAEEERPDHPSSHRMLAFARLKKGDFAGAFAAARAGLARRYPEGRFAGVERILREDLGLIGAAWAKAEPARGAELRRRVVDAGGTIEDAPSLRFVLTWETDANDVDFHIIDASGGHAYYQQPKLTSGGELYADVTTGYGPECFTIRAPRSKRAGPYTLQAHYYARGPMGYGMGKLEIIDHDGSGGLTFDERPYVVMADQAFVELGLAPLSVEPMARR